MSKTVSTSNGSGKEGPVCEICCYGPSYGDRKMVRCRECEIHVHLECYFLEADGGPYIENGKITCLACQSVGRTVQAVEKNFSSNYRLIKQVSRPLRCELCSVSGRVTAMHPLYDNHGKSGRQICRKNPEGDYRLAWGHTICCNYLTSQGFMYGFFSDGAYIDDSGEDDEKDQRTPNVTTVLTAEFQAQITEARPIVYYRYYLPKQSPKKLDVYRKIIKDYRSSLTCSVCGKHDKSDNDSMRIPCQCIAGMETEFDWLSSGRVKLNGRRLHKDLEFGASCAVALHVGCARWGGNNENNLQRVHLSPTDEMCLYCTNHAADVGIKLPKPRKKYKEAVSDKAFSSVTSTNSNSTLIQHVPRKPSFIDATAEPKDNKRKGSTASVDLSVLTQPSVPRKKHKGVSTLDAKYHESGNENTDAAGIRRAHQWGRKQKDRFVELDPSLAVAVNEVDRPTLKRRRRNLADQKSKVTDHQVQEVLNDLIKNVDSKSDSDQLATALKGRRIFWKREFSELTKSDFLHVWNEAKRKFYKVKSIKPIQKQIITQEKVARIAKKAQSAADPGAHLIVETLGRAVEAHSKDDFLSQPFEDGEVHQDCWSHLFVGPSFRLGNEFNLQDFEEYL